MMDLASINDAVNNAVKNATNTAIKDAIHKAVKDAAKEAIAAEVKEWEKKIGQVVTKKVEDAWHRMTKPELDLVKLNMTDMEKKLKEKISKHTGREFIKYELQNQTALSTRHCATRRTLPSKRRPADGKTISRHCRRRCIL
jgi:hypothetical protein